MITTIVHGYMNRCDCGNLFIPSGKHFCPECIRKSKAEKLIRLTIAREQRRQAKLAKKEQRKRRQSVDA